MTREQILATAAGRELDAVVAERVMGLKEVTSWADGVCRSRMPFGWHDVPCYSTEIAAAWQVFVRGLTNSGNASICGDMEDFGRGAFTRGKADEVVTVTVGEWSVTGPVCLAICQAALLALTEAR
jgi:hypothetical protein